MIEPFEVISEDRLGIGFWEQKIYKFSNGYGASVVRHKGSYGFENGLWELAVIRWLPDGKFVLCYDTDITSDVIGHLTEEQVEEILGKIEFYPL